MAAANAQVLMHAGSIGGSGTESSRSVASDPAGNLVITGCFQGTGADFDPGPGKAQLSASGQSQDIFLAKYDPAGNYLWANKIGGSGDDIPAKVIIDPEGNIYIAGWYQSAPCDFDPGPGNLNLPTAGLTDMFFARFDPEGNLVWANRVGGAGYDGIHDMVFDNDGNLLITGYYNGDVDFNPASGISTLNDTGGGDMFFAKYSKQGQLLDARHAGGTQYEVGNSIAVDRSGNIYISGPFMSTDADFDPGPGIARLSSAGSYDMYLVKFDAALNFQWVNRTGGNLEEIGGTLTTDPYGNVIVTGVFQSAGIDFDPGAGNVSGTPVGGRDISLVKFTPQGTLSWAKTFGGVQDDYSLGLQTDPNGIIYLSGNFLTSMDVDPGAAIKTLTSAGGYDAFLVTLDSNGNYINHIATRGTGDETGGPLAWDPAGNLLTAYGFSGSHVDFDPGQGTCEFTSKGSSDLAIVRYNLPSLKPYMGQTVPQNSIRRFPPDNMQMLAVANTWWWHGSPIFSPDQKEMFFTKYLDGPEKIEIWYTKLVGNQWTLPVAAPFGNRTVAEGNPAFSASGDTLWFFSARNGAGGIFQTIKMADGSWSAPTQVNVPIPAGLSMGWTFSIAKNRNLYLDLFNNQSQSDICCFTWSSDHYLDPVALPQEINTTYGDNASFISPDEDFIVFASNRPGSAGLHDLYVSFRNPDNTWSQSKNLGSMINASHEDAFPWISPDGKYLFFNSARTGDLGYNPYWISSAFIEQMKPLPEQAEERIAFVSTRDGNGEIYTMLTNGADVKRLTDSESADLFPAWAPGGNQIAFISDRGGKPELYVMESDGVNQHKILDNNLMAGSPNWSPDGAHILFTLSENETQEEFQICLIHPDGSGFQLLEDAGEGTGPVWTADGKSILFSSNRSGIFQIYSMDPDGNNLVQLTNSETHKTNPKPSPDGSLIAYTEPARTIYPARLRIISNNGTSDRILSDLSNSREHPCWSADSQTLFFQSSRFGNSEIYSVNVSDRFLTNISRNQDEDLYPAIPAKKITSGIPGSETSVTGNVSVWPVPATNELNVSLSSKEYQDIRITIEDMTGKTIRERVFEVASGASLTVKMDLTGLQPGSYAVRIQLKYQIITKQIIKE